MAEPNTCETLRRTVGDLDQRVSRVRAVQPGWAARGDAEPVDLLLRAADTVEAAVEPLAELLP